MCICVLVHAQRGLLKLACLSVFVSVSPFENAVTHSAVSEGLNDRGFSLKSLSCRHPALPALYGYPLSAIFCYAEKCACAYIPDSCTTCTLNITVIRHFDGACFSLGHNGFCAKALHFSAFHIYICGWVKLKWNVISIPLNFFFTEYVCTSTSKFAYNI